MTTATGSEFISPEQAAERYGVNVSTIRRLIRDGEIPAYMLGPRLARINTAEADAALRAGGTRE